MIPAPRVRASSSILDAVAARVLRHGSGLTSLETLALLGLARLADDAEGGPVVRTHGDLAGRWACSPATVKRVTSQLALRGLIRIERRSTPWGQPAPSAYALDLAALGVAMGSPCTVDGAERPAPLVTRASDPDLRSDPSPEIDPRSERVGHAPPADLPEVRDAAAVLRATLAAEPVLAAYAVPAVVGPLAAAVVRARKPARVAAMGLVQLAAAVAVCAAGGAPWSPREVLRGLTSWALAARGDVAQEAAGDYRARVAADLAASRSGPTRGVVVRPRVDARAAAEVARACVSRVA